ncbi:hypothetical protein [Flammeovirga sp. OC4]|uniref:hypothetical protein n=1 Tax=Flammeovirga sp. OC4 TaxID=1382345 RepID=UPI000694FD49|nr:hypothetical protein [Flammeovirga sp. OC4]
MNKRKIIFSHLWVSGFGWENTILDSDDFEEIELLGINEVDGEIFVGLQDNKVERILKVDSKTKKNEHKNTKNLPN